LKIANGWCGFLGFEVVGLATGICFVRKAVYVSVLSKAKREGGKVFKADFYYSKTPLPLRFESGELQQKKNLIGKTKPLRGDW